MGKGQMGAWVCRALRLSSVPHLLGDRGEGRKEGTAPPTWASEAKERMAEVAATEPQGSLRGSQSLGTVNEASRERECGGGPIPQRGSRGCLGAPGRR